MKIYFSRSRFYAIYLKEFMQMKRDKFTFAMMIGIPLIQLILFGFAINSDPKHLPTAIVAADQSVFTRAIIADLKNSSYFKIIKGNSSASEAEQLLRIGKIQFIIFFPQHFTERLIHSDKPELLLEADATDPAATSYSLSVFQNMNQILAKNFTGSLAYLRLPDPPINLIIHPKYNPERRSDYNIVPGLLGVVLTMTMVVITSLAITRERERGTMEGLLAMPVGPLEVMLGKILPYISVGYIQFSFILFLAYFMFSIPINGSLILLYLACFPFILANLTVGLIFSTIAKNQLQAMQSAFFFFLPSMLLSGFMFPFYGMPDWAQAIGNCLPLTHFLLIVRGIMLKGNGLYEIFTDLKAILLFFFVMLILGLLRYRQTLD